MVNKHCGYICVCVRRYQLPIIFIVMNNNGIYAGLDDDTFKEISDGGDPMLRFVSSLQYVCTEPDHCITLQCS